jgi:drug/metabolite transporter (DMT)-like permease
MEPLVAVISSALLLNEKMTPIQIAGGICIIGGAMIGELIKRKNTE